MQFVKTILDCTFHFFRRYARCLQTWQKITGGNFSLSEYVDLSGKKNPEYHLDKKESLYIGTKFNDEARAKLIMRWEFLEREKQSAQLFIPQTLSEALRLAADQAEENEKLLKENNRLQERTQFVDVVFNADDLLTGSQVCKILKLPYGNITLYKKLRESGIFFKNKNEPKQEYVDRGYFRMKEIMIGDIIKLQTYFTQKGLGYISKFTGIVRPPIAEIKFLNT